jgi:biopolymer transport protein ExbB/TolQ
MEKAPGFAVLAGSFAEALIVFALGLSVCAALYAAFSVFEGVLSRRKANTDDEGIPTKPRSLA